MINIKIFLIIIILFICLYTSINKNTSETFRLNFNLQHTATKNDLLSLKIPLNITKSDNINDVEFIKDRITDFEIKDKEIHIIYKSGYENNPYIRKYLYYNVNIFKYKYEDYYNNLATFFLIEFSPDTEDIIKFHKFRKFYAYINDTLWPKLKNIEYNDTYNFKGNKVNDTYTQLLYMGDENIQNTSWENKTTIQNVNKYKVPLTNNNG